MQISSRCCAVCGDSPAKIHYGVLACFGCKGFFRRAVKDGRNKYVCRLDKNCEVNKNERNSCRYCRFRRCLYVGMNPDFVRPDREDTKQKKRLLSKKKSLGRTASAAVRQEGEDWTIQLFPSQKRMLNLLNSLDTQLQSLLETNYDGVALFSLKSLIADRTLARQTGPSSSMPAGHSSTTLLAIEKIVSTIDYMDGFLVTFDSEVVRRISVEDKCAFIGDSFLPLSLIDTAARLVARHSANFSEDLIRTLPAKNLSFICLAKFNRLCESFKKRSPSPMEYSVLRALLLCSADATMLSNTLGDMLAEVREGLQELLFRVIKLARRISSVSAAGAVADLVAVIYQARDVAIPLHSTLAPLYPPNMVNGIPFQRIISDILNPEVSDLLAQAKSTISTEAFSPPNLHQPSPRPAMIAPLYSPMPPPVSTFTAPLPVRPRNIGFSPKLPLTITKSIEEMLRAPGSGDDSILTRPLDSNWADNVRLTPVFNKDVVAQFFPELGNGLF